MGIKGLGSESVRGRNLSPRPPAKIKHVSNIR